MQKIGVESDGELFLMQKEAMEKANLANKSYELGKSREIYKKSRMEIPDIFKKLKSDDVILLCIIFFLINENYDKDYILITALLYISGII